MMTAAGSSGKVAILNILNMLLWVGKIKPTPMVLNAINQRLNSETAKYPPSLSGSQNLYHFRGN